MAKYLEVAAEANKVALSLMETIKGPMGPEEYAKVAEMIARLVNLGIRCSPRGVQHTVRLNAVARAVQDLPVRVSMDMRTDDKTHRTYHVLVTQQLVAGHLNGVASVETLSGDDD